jgi:hypothetical protein
MRTTIVESRGGSLTSSRGGPTLAEEFGSAGRSVAGDDRGATGVGAFTVARSFARLGVPRSPRPNGVVDVSHAGPSTSA